MHFRYQVLPGIRPLESYTQALSGPIRSDKGVNCENQRWHLYPLEPRLRHCFIESFLQIEKGTLIAVYTLFLPFLPLSDSLWGLAGLLVACWVHRTDVRLLR